MARRKRQIPVSLVGIILLLVLVGIYLSSTVQQTAFTGTGQRFNANGRFVFDLNQDEIEFNPQDTPTLSYPYTLTIYPGLGWDDICYSEMVGWYVEEDTVFNAQVVKGGKLEHSIKTVSLDGTLVQSSLIRTDPDRENRPFTVEGSADFTITDLPDGRYRIKFINFITPFTDIPSSGNCAFQEDWYNAINGADQALNFDATPLAWFTMVSESTNVRTDFLELRRFVVDGSLVEELPPEPSPGPSPGPDVPPIAVEQPGTGTNLLPFILVIVLIILVVIFFVVRRRK